MPRRVVMRPLVALLPALALDGARRQVKHERWSNSYDRYFPKQTKRYFAEHFDWHGFKAQAIAESALDPDERSPSGARGVVQIPATYREIQAQNTVPAKIEDPRWNSAVGIFYDCQPSRDEETSTILALPNA